MTSYDEMPYVYALIKFYEKNMGFSKPMIFDKYESLLEYLNRLYARYKMEIEEFNLSDHFKDGWITVRNEHWEIVYKVYQCKVHS